ncbi:hypothetical protein DFH29DRAFT_195343 [Suillus ampliporus]|nr:hypothetical protein DFH29DRAFT_195343 [Suillus ampliporus]
MVVGLLSLPTELICHILLHLTPRDLSRCATTCKTIGDVAQNSVDIQYQLELYAQGFTEPHTLDCRDVSRKMCSLKKLTSLWRSDFHLNTVCEEIAPVVNGHLTQSVKCGTWWIWGQDDLLIRDFKTTTKLSHTSPRLDWSSQYQNWWLMSVVIDPLQDLVVAVSLPRSTHVTDTVRYVFSVDFRLASSQLPHPDSACAFLECDESGAADSKVVHLVGMPAICGDRVVVLYYLAMFGSHEASNMSIQVIDWRKGHVTRHPLGERGGVQATFHLVDEQTIVVGSEDRMVLYTLQGFDGSPQRRITYLLPNLKTGHDSWVPIQSSTSSYNVVYATPSFRGAAARADLLPSYVPFLESQIMVLEILPTSWPVIIVIDMVIFSEKVIISETPVEIPWSDWGPKYTWCFPHHPSHRISVFGSKMAYALPRDHIPEPGQRVEALSHRNDFYVHIWDFNKRFIARSKNMRDPDSPDLVIRKPGRLAQSCFDEDMISDNPYIATVCPEPFSTRFFDKFFLEQDRLTLTWLPDSAVHIRVVSPVQMEAGSDPGRH